MIPGNRRLTTLASVLIIGGFAALSLWSGWAEAAEQWLNEKKVVAADQQEGDWFGLAVAVSGDTMVVGASREDGGVGDPEINMGAAYVFDRDPLSGNWIQTAKLTASDAQRQDLFGSAVAIDGDRIVVGAISENGGPGSPIIWSGAAYVFQRSGGGSSWQQVAKLRPDNDDDLVFFGGAVGISGDTIAVGAVGDNSVAPDGGAVYVFDNNPGGPGSWSLTIKLTAADAQASDWFGNSVALEGDYLVVGAAGEDGGAGNPLMDTGAAYLFERDSGGSGLWEQKVQLAPQDPIQFGRFGSYVGISGETAVIGSWYLNGTSAEKVAGAGAAYVFERDQDGVGSWGQTAKLTPADGQDDDAFGTAVAIDNNTIVVGAFAESGGPGDPLPLTGAVYYFSRDLNNPNLWGQILKIIAGDAQSNDYYGSVVAVDGDSVVVGSPGEDGDGDLLVDAGAVYVYPAEISEPTDVTLTAFEEQTRKEYPLALVWAGVLVIGLIGTSVLYNRLRRYTR